MLYSMAFTSNYSYLKRQVASSQYLSREIAMMVAYNSNYAMRSRLFDNSSALQLFTFEDHKKLINDFGLVYMRRLAKSYSDVGTERDIELLLLDTGDSIVLVALAHSPGVTLEGVFELVEYDDDDISEPARELLECYLSDEYQLDHGMVELKHQLVSYLNVSDIKIFSMGLCDKSTLDIQLLKDDDVSYYERVYAKYKNRGWLLQYA